ncbi:hypothetical protein yinte0001_27580 [Yersinia intermedia ATCC 29909]|nr:hypothetical protein yinte0001_27580 [Yersinia intermedia ATCC 29909]
MTIKGIHGGIKPHCEAQGWWTEPALVSLLSGRDQGSA